MPTQGPNSGSSFNGAGVDFGGIAWSTASNLATSDNAYATVTLDDSTWSQALKAVGFGFSIPTDAIIAGIVVEVERKCTSPNSIQDWFNAFKLTKNGSTQVGSDRASSTYYPTTDTIATYGSSVDLWGTTWTPAEINSANFGLLFAAVNNGAIGTNTASVDHIKITVTYTMPTGGGQRYIGSSMAVKRASFY